MSRSASGVVLQAFDRLFRDGTASGWAESELLDRFLFDADDHAFEAIVTRFGPMVLTVCRRYLSDPEDVADAFQATFLVLVRRAASIRHRALLGNWLYGTATKVAQRARSRKWTRQRVERTGFDPPDVLVSNSDEPGSDDDYRVLHDELARLPEKYRRPLVLCYFEGQTHEQAAARLRWPVGTVRGRLHRARERLRHRLVARGVESPVPLIVTALAPSRGLLPLRLVSQTCTLARAASLPTGWALAAGASPTGAVALAQGVLASMAFSPMKISVLALAGLGLLTSGVASTAYQFGSNELAPLAGRPASVETTSARPAVSGRILEARLQAKRSELKAAEAQKQRALSRADHLGKMFQKGLIPDEQFQEAQTEILVRDAERERINAELTELLITLEEAGVPIARSDDLAPASVSLTEPMPPATPTLPSNPGRDDITQRLDAIEAKLDTILAHLSNGPARPSRYGSTPTPTAPYLSLPLDPNVAPAPAAPAVAPTPSVDLAPTAPAAPPPSLPSPRP